MPEFLNWPTIILAIIAALVVILNSWNNYNSIKKSEGVVNNHTSAEHSETRDYTKELLSNINNDNLIGALKVFSEGNLEIKKGIILELKNKAIYNPDERQKIVDFLSTLNDWITENEEYKEVLLNPETDWGRWFDYKSIKSCLYCLKKDGEVFEKEKQILSMESSNAIYEIISQHIKEPNAKLLEFRNKNLLGIKFLHCDFQYSNIDFYGVNFIGTHFRFVRNINKTNFQYANYYGHILFTNMLLPKDIYILGEVGTRYYGNVSFLDVKFPQGVCFIDAIFDGDFIINSSVFKEDAHFEMANFKGKAQLFRCKFENGALFTSAIFNKKAIFDNSEFLGKTNFNNEQFLEGYSFQGATFSQEPNLTIIQKNTGFIDLRGMRK